MRIPHRRPPLPLIFLDTNIFLRHLRNDHPDWSRACHQVFISVEQGRLDAWTTDLAIAEIVFLLESHKHYDQPRQAIADSLLPLLFLPHLRLDHKQFYKRIFSFYTTYPQLSYVDCYNAAYVMANDVCPEIFSYDTDFDRIGYGQDSTSINPLRRFEPAPVSPDEEAA